MNARAELSAQAINTLDAEHRNIEVILETLENLHGSQPDWGTYERAIALIEEYADHYHHAKEEELLFPAMIEAGIPQHNSPVSCMAEEHKLARALVANMRDHLSNMNIEEMRATAERYCTLMREHIAKEDNILYPMALQVIPTEGWRELARKFIECEEQLGGDTDMVRRAMALRRRTHKA